VDAVELLRSDAPFVVDTSAWWRFSALSGVWLRSSGQHNATTAPVVVVA
jgi:hypothetical protein